METTTTPDCNCSAATSTSTTTPEPPDCSCSYPLHCGQFVGECTYTFCSRYPAPIHIECTTTSTTTTCDCNTTTTADPGCTEGCDWVWIPMLNSGFGDWQQVSNGCSSDCPCLHPVQTGASPCSDTHTDCQVGIPIPCHGECHYVWNTLVDDWVEIPSMRTCNSSTDYCGCEKPSEPGEDCTTIATRCTDQTPNTTPNPCYNCYTTSTTTTTTTSRDCAGSCMFRWLGSTWVEFSNECTGACDCSSPPISGFDTCEVAWTECLPQQTTTTTTSTTTTTTTSNVCAQPGNPHGLCILVCRSDGVYVDIYSSCGGECICYSTQQPTAELTPTAYAGDPCDFEDHQGNPGDLYAPISRGGNCTTTTPAP
jgi:hypothetical protein